MDYLVQGFNQALELLFAGDPEVYQIIILSLSVSLSATVLAALVGVPLGLFTGLAKFPCKKIFTTILYTSMGIPPVVMGLIVALLLSRKGPLGTYELLFTPNAMILAQFLLICPIVTGIVFGTARQKGREAYELALTLGATPYQRAIFLLSELRITLMLAMATAFGRAISEVGAVMLVGGNIKGHTRVMTTFIAMNNSMGEYEKSIAMAIVLLLLALVINGVVHHLAGGKSFVD